MSTLERPSPLSFELVILVIVDDLRHLDKCLAIDSPTSQLHLPDDVAHLAFFHLVEVAWSPSFPEHTTTMMCTYPVNSCRLGTWAPISAALLSTFLDIELLNTFIFKVYVVPYI
eukprot:EG_transcript_42660